jgi:ankyrin repeat protein
MVAKAKREQVVSELHSFITEGDVDSIGTLLSGYNPKEQRQLLETQYKNADGFEPALVAAVKYHQEAVVRKLLTYRPYINRTDSDGQTALMVATRNDEQEIALALLDYINPTIGQKGLIASYNNLKAGNFIKEGFPSYNRPPNIAARENRPEILGNMFEHGLRVNDVQIYPLTHPEIAVCAFLHGASGSDLLAAAAYDEKPNIVRALAEAGANTNEALLHRDMRYPEKAKILLHNISGDSITYDTMRRYISNITVSTPGEIMGDYPKSDRIALAGINFEHFLSQAVERKDVEILSQLFFDYPEKIGEIFLNAVTQNNLNLVNFCFEIGVTTQNAQRAFVTALENENVGLVKTLLDHHVCPPNSLIDWSARQGKMEIVEAIVTASKSSPKPKKKLGKVINNGIDNVLFSGPDHFASDLSRELDRAVTEALNRNSLTGITTLLEAGVSPNCSTGNGTAFALAVFCGNTDIIQAMLKHGAQMGEVSYRQFREFIKRSEDSPEKLDVLLKRPDVNKDAVLVDAVEYNDIRSVQVALEYGAKPDSRNRQRKTVSEIAAANGFAAISDLLPPVEDGKQLRR